MAQGRRIRLCVIQDPLQKREILQEERILHIPQVLTKKRRIPQEGRKQHVMDPKGNLAGPHSLFSSAKEKRDIRRTGSDIKHHKPAARIFGSTETEIGPQG